jgi:2-alkyl-3-oxoalkanoate reductase
VRVFIAGATGAIGQQLVPALLGRGHSVTGLTRQADRAAWLKRLGAQACEADIYDSDALTAGIADARPDVVIHQLTALPHRYEIRRRDINHATDRIRREGTRNLVASARAAGCHRIVAQSTAFLYRPDDSGQARVEPDAPFTDAPPPFAATVDALLDLEAQVLASGISGAILRYGWLYGPGTWYAPDGYFADEVRRRRYPIVGSGSGEWSFVHVADAADAAVRLTETRSEGIFNIVEDEALPMRRWLPDLAKTLDAPPPRRIPRWVARLAAGPLAAEMATRMPGADNTKANQELGWTPLHRFPR